MASGGLTNIVNKVKSTAIAVAGELTPVLKVRLNKTIIWTKLRIIKQFLYTAQCVYLYKCVWLVYDGQVVLVVGATTGNVMMF